MALRHIEGDFTHGLNRIGVEGDSSRLDNLSDFLDRENHASLVIGIHDTDQGRPVCDCFSEFIQIEPSLAVYSQLCHAVSPGSQVLADVQNSRVLDPRRNHVILVGVRFQGTPDGRIITLRAAAGKNNLRRVCMEEGRNPFSRL